MLDNFLQSVKAPPSIVERFDENFTSGRLEHPLKADIPMVVTEFGIVNYSSGFVDVMRVELLYRCSPDNCDRTVAPIPDPSCRSRIGFAVDNGVFITAIKRTITAHFDNADRYVGFLQGVASIKGIAADFFDGVGNDDLGKALTVIEDMLSKFCDALGNMDLSQTPTFAKSTISDLGYAVV